MAISEMQKVRMVVHKTVADDVMSRIQKLGCCHFVSDAAKADERDIAPLRARLKEIDGRLGDVKAVSRFLEPYASGKAAPAASYTMEELARASSSEAFGPTSSKMHALEKKLSDIRNGISRVSGLIGQLEPLESLPCALDFYTVGTDTAAGGVYQLQAAAADALAADVKSSSGGMSDVTVLPSSGKETSRYVSVIYERGQAAKVQEALAHAQASKVDVPSGLTGTAAEELASLRKEHEELERALHDAEREAFAAADSAMAECRAVSDYWSIEKSRADTLIDGGQTEQISIYKFWIPKDMLDKFKAAVADHEALIDVAMIEADEGEMPPTLLHNTGLSGPVEPLIEMYGTPTYGSFDPTIVVAPFFYMFFGICFGDAGYGLLIASLLTVVMIKKRLTGTVRKFAMILILGNICALIFGAISFSWFGDSISAFGGLDKDGAVIENASITFLRFLAPLKKLQILDPMNDPMTMLYVSLALGFFQLMVGLLVALVQNVKHGRAFAAFADQGGWMIFLIGLVLFGLASQGVIQMPSNIAGGVAAAGAIILVLTQGREKKNVFGKLFSGIMSLYGVTGYLGDVLSYSRLLALGLGSAAVGMVINLLATLVSGVPYVGVVLAVVVFVVGHLFGIAANILGAFVHSLRLQYVEFFGKFHEASGEEFHPLRLAVQYVKIAK